jgi:hypothetical protein
VHKTRLPVAPLRILLALFFAALVMLQTFSLPGQFRYMAEENPEDAGLRWPALAIAVLVLLCVQVVIVCTWKLLTMVQDGRIFSEASLRWVDGILWAIGTAWTIIACVFAVAIFTADDPGVGVLLTVILLGGAVAELLLMVMRALLLQATTLRTEMDSVI